MNKLPNFEKILTQTIRDINPEFNYGETDFDVFKTLDFCFDPSPKRGIIFTAVKEYGRQVRDYTLQVASREMNLIDRYRNEKYYNTTCNVIDQSVGTITLELNREDILNLKNSKELEI